MNIIGIDPSITSTGLCVNGKLFNYSYEEKAYTKKGELTKWFKDCDYYMIFRFHHQAKYNSYVEEQVHKLIQQKKIVSNIMTDIYNNIDLNDDTIVGIEGYSYSSSTSSIIDLVQFGTLIRSELVKLTTDIIIISPSTLKLETCKMAYKPIEKTVGKRKPKIVLEHRNNEGIAGGKFTKVEMHKALIEKGDWGDIPTELIKYIDYLKTVEYGKNIPKPIEDISDSTLLWLYLFFNQTL